jgi:hypothetical protein
MFRKPEMRVCDWEETMKDKVYDYFKSFDRLEVTLYDCIGDSRTLFFDREENIWSSINSVMGFVMQDHIIGFDMYKA